MFSFDTPLSTLPTFKKTILSKLKRLNIETVRDLLFHLPKQYDDFSIIRPIGELTAGELCTVEGTVTKLSAGRTFHKHLFLTEATIGDGSGTVRAIWFGNKFIAATLTEGLAIRLSGKVTEDKKGLLFQGPDQERAARDATHTARLVPVYPETAGVTSRFFRWQIAEVLKKIQILPDPVPSDILKRNNLPSLLHTLQSIHFPKDANDWQVARKRFAFDEVFTMQIKALQVKALFDTSRAVRIPVNTVVAEAFIRRLPFTLTDAQQKANTEILADLANGHPMNRLLNGDVGSGKTIVAGIAARAVALADFQTVILAPTEILARQHFESLSVLFKDELFQTALLTREYHILGNEKASKASLISAIRSGIPNVIIGTHAILQDSVRFKNLALVIVDEQHRFGVAQRAYLQQESSSLNDGLTNLIPHFLTMTATPIPRTLALAFFGNLDLSVLDEMPKSRKPIITKIARNTADRDVVYAFIRKEIAKGRQVFVILPLVEESEALEDVKAATIEAARLQMNVFPELKIGLIHGRLKSKEKESVMNDFKEKRFDILVATSVVEVGIDIPNASVIVIENADRFGLSQLHQFRGRVGRSVHQSYCFLFPGENASAENKRLEALEKSASGFEIAEADLLLRGPGAFFGTRQSGLPDIAMENLTNLRLIEIARSEASTILATDPTLEHHPLLRTELQKFEEKIHLE